MEETIHQIITCGIAAAILLVVSIVLYVIVKILEIRELITETRAYKIIEEEEQLAMKFQKDKDERDRKLVELQIEKMKNEEELYKRHLIFIENRMKSLDNKDANQNTIKSNMSNSSSVLQNNTFGIKTKNNLFNNSNERNKKI